MKRRSVPLFEKTRRSFFESLDGWTDIVNRTKDLRLEGNELIYLAAVGSKETLPALLQSRYVPQGVQQLRSTDTSSLFSYHRRYGHKNQHAVSGQFLVSQTPLKFIHLILCISESHFWRHGVLHLLDSLYPRAALPFLTQKETHQILGHVQRAIQPR